MQQGLNDLPAVPAESVGPWLALAKLRGPRDFLPGLDAASALCRDAPVSWQAQQQQQLAAVVQLVA